MARTPKYKDSEIIAAIAESQGFVSAAADKLGITTSTIYKRAKRNPAIWDAINEPWERHVDLAELMTLKLMEEGDKWAIGMVLTKKGKKRGWGDEHQVTHDGTVRFMPPTVIVSSSDQISSDSTNDDDEDSTSTES